MHSLMYKCINKIKIQIYTKCGSCPVSVHLGKYYIIYLLNELLLLLNTVII